MRVGALTQSQASLKSLVTWREDTISDYGAAAVVCLVLSSHMG